MVFDFSIIEVIIMIIAAQVFGMIWYGPLFGKIWSRAMKVDESQVSKKEMQKKVMQHAGILVLQVVALGFLMPVVVVNPFLFVTILWAALSVPGILMGIVWENTPKAVALLNLSASIIVLNIIMGIHVWIG